MTKMIKKANSIWFFVEEHSGMKEWKVYSLMMETIFSESQFTLQIILHIQMSVNFHLKKHSCIIRLKYFNSTSTILDNYIKTMGDCASKIKPKGIANIAGQVGGAMGVQVPDLGNALEIVGGIVGGQGG